MAIVAAGCCAAASVARAAPRPWVDHRVRLGLGYADLTLLDRGATNLPYKGTLFDGDLSYQADRPWMRWYLELGSSAGPYGALGFRDRAVTFASETVTGDVERTTVPMRGLLVAPRVRAGIQYRWNVVHGLLSVFAGAELAWDVRYPQGFATPGLMQVLSLQPTATVRVNAAPRHAVELGTRLAVAEWVTRMPWHQSVSLPGKSAAAGWIRQGSRFASLGSLQAITVEGGYVFRFRPRWSFDARYVMGWLHDATVRGLQSVEHRVTFGMAVHW